MFAGQAADLKIPNYFSPFFSLHISFRQSIMFLIPVYCQGHLIMRLITVNDLCCEVARYGFSEQST